MLARPLGKVKWEDRLWLHGQYREFCHAHGLDADCYPISRESFHEFCQALEIGEKSRHGRTLRRNLKDSLCRPARLQAGVPPKSGPPMGRPDHHGVRHYYTLAQCRVAGYRSGASRRFHTRHRDTRIRQHVHKRGLTPTEAAQRAGVSVRTVYDVLRRRPVHRLGEPAPKLPGRACAANNLGQAAEPAVTVGPAATVVRVVDPVAAPPPTGPPRFARPAVALKLHWLSVVDPARNHVADARLRSIRARQTRSLRRDLRHYAAAIRQQDGPQRWNLVLTASQQWLDELHQAGVDPVPFLAARNRHPGPGRHPPLTGVGMRF